MAFRFAISSSDWTSGSTWDSFAQLGFPTAEDDVWANSYTVNVDTSIAVRSLNNSQTPRVVENIATPAMTSNATPSGFVYASSFRNAGEEPWRAFDQNAGTNWVANTLNTGSLTYQFPTARNIKRYAIRGTTAANNPRQWTFEGSNDNISFAILDTVTSSIATSAVYTSAILANTASFTFYRLNVTAVGTLNNNLALIELELTESTGSGAGNLSGGSFNFNTPNVSASVGAGLTAGATNLITVTATTGTVNVSAPNAAVTGVGAQAILHSGACDFIITGSSFTPGSTINSNTINKNSTGTITIRGNLLGTTLGGINPTNAFNSTTGNTVIIGNLIGGNSPSNTVTAPVVQSAGFLTIVGNVVAGAGNVNNFGINFSGTSLTITGSITGGTGTNAAPAINITSTPTINISGSINAATSVGISSATANITNIIGNVNGSANAAGISYTGAATLTVRGTVTAGTGQPAISSTSTSANNIIYGNLVNTNGIMAFFGPRLQIGSGSLTTWQFTTNTGIDRTLYTLNQIGDQPSPSNVRSGISYAGGTLTGTMTVPPSGSVALGVPVGNTTGSAILNPTYVADEIWNQPVSTLAVSGSIGERIKNAATVATTGAQIVALTGGN